MTVSNGQCALGQVCNLQTVVERNVGRYEHSIDVVHDGHRNLIVGANAQQFSERGISDGCHTLCHRVGQRDNGSTASKWLNAYRRQRTL